MKNPAAGPVSFGPAAEFLCDSSRKFLNFISKNRSSGEVFEIDFKKTGLITSQGRAHGPPPLRHICISNQKQYYIIFARTLAMKTERMVTEVKPEMT